VRRWRPRHAGNGHGRGCRRGCGRASGGRAPPRVGHRRCRPLAHDWGAHGRRRGDPRRRAAVRLDARAEAHKAHRCLRQWRWWRGGGGRVAPDDRVGDVRMWTRVGSRWGGLWGWHRVGGCRAGGCHWSCVVPHPGGTVRWTVPPVPLRWGAADLRRLTGCSLKRPEPRRWDKCRVRPKSCRRSCRRCHRRSRRRYHGHDGANAPRVATPSTRGWC